MSSLDSGKCVAERIFQYRWTRWISTAGFLLLAFPNLICIAEIIRTNQHYRLTPASFQSLELFFCVCFIFFNSMVAVWKHGLKSIYRKVLWLQLRIKILLPLPQRCKFLEINRAVPLPMFESLLREEGANYLLTSNIFGNIPEYFTAITESGRFRFELLTTIGSLRVYAIHNRLTEPGFRSNARNRFFWHPALQPIFLFKRGTCCAPNDIPKL